VGYSIQVDEDFDYQNRLSEIREELACLNTNANELMGLIQGISV
jgi:type I restriction enzyme M protein